MSVQQAHDHFFRESFGRLEIARNYLEEYLPQPVLAQLDLSEMQIQDGSFIDEAMQSHQTDIIYQVHLKSGQPAYAYFLFEHKSYPDKWVAYQLLRYQMRLWEREMKETQTLSPILPIVLYHGERPWQIPTDFASLITTTETRQAFQAYIPNFSYLLGDFSYLSDEEIRGEVWLRVTLSIFRAIFNPQLRQELPTLIQLVFELTNQNTGLDYIRTILYYLTKATGRVKRQDLRRVLQQQKPQGETIMGTIAEEYIQEGRQKGRQEGALTTTREYIAELLAIRLNIPEETYTAELQTITNLTTLKNLHRLAATAASINTFHNQLQQDLQNP